MRSNDKIPADEMLLAEAYAAAKASGLRWMSGTPFIHESGAWTKSPSGAVGCCARADGYDAAGLAPDYEALSPADIREVCESWSPRTRGWMVSLTDWALVDTWRTELARIGRYAFPPVPCVIKGMSFRAQHDDPDTERLIRERSCK